MEKDGIELTLDDNLTRTLHCTEVHLKEREFGKAEIYMMLRLGAFHLAETEKSRSHSACSRERQIATHLC